MKNVLFVLLVVLPLITWSNVLPERIADSDIEHVTVFRNGAQVQRTASFHLEIGMNNIVIPGLSQHLDNQSIQIKSKSDFILMSVNTLRNHIHPIEESSMIKNLKDQLEQLKDEEANTKALIEILEEKEILIKENRLLYRDENGLEIDKLRKALALYDEELKQIKLEKIALKKQNREQLKQITKVQNQMNEIRNAHGGGNSMDLYLSMLSEKAQKIEIEFSYLVNNASWQSTYDLKVEDIDSPMRILTKGMIRQATGEQWDNVKLTLSTGNPRRSTYRPVLNPWWLQFYQAGYASSSYYVDGVRVTSAPQTRNMRVEKEAADMDEAMAMPTAVASENMTSMEFELAERFTIAPNNQFFTVLLDEQEVEAKYIYHTAPKLGRDAFLTASIFDWEDINLSSGVANLYFEDSYLGKSQINTMNTGDSLVISLGVDIGVTVKRTKQKKYTEKKLLGTKRKATVGWEIEVKNNKTEAIEIVITDQIPLSADSNIEIMDVDLGNAILDKETGIITWTVNLEPGQKVSKEFRYTVRYPKNQQLLLE